MENVLWTAERATHAFAAAIFGCLAALVVAHTTPVATGPAIVVVDGDTVEVAGKRIRLLGLDTPEIFRPKCAAEREAGLVAAAHLVALIASGPAKLEETGRKGKYKRGLARLKIGDRDVATAMIASGHARPYGGGKRRGWCP